MCPDLRGLSWGIEFGQKAIGQFLLGPIYTGGLALEPELSSDSVTPFYKVSNMVMRTLTRVTAELVPLNHLDKVRLQFKIFCTESGFDDTWNGSLGEHGRTQLAKGLVSVIGHLALLSP